MNRNTDSLKKITSKTLLLSAPEPAVGSFYGDLTGVR